MTVEYSHSTVSSNNSTGIDQAVAHILVADDDLGFIRLLEENLVQEGYRVSQAFDGQMALRVAGKDHFDLIILDVNMPMTNGLKVFEYLRASPANAKTPVIFISGEPTKDIYPIIANAPRVAHIKKPLDLESLNSLVREFLAKYPNH